jgi:hypothetical protein
MSLILEDWFCHHIPLQNHSILISEICWFLVIFHCFRKMDFALISVCNKKTMCHFAPETSKIVWIHRIFHFFWKFNCVMLSFFKDNIQNSIEFHEPPKFTAFLKYLVYSEIVIWILSHSERLIQTLKCLLIHLILIIPNNISFLLESWFVNKSFSWAYWSFNIPFNSGNQLISCDPSLILDDWFGIYLSERKTPLFSIFFDSSNSSDLL